MQLPSLMLPWSVFKNIFKKKKLNEREPDWDTGCLLDSTECPSNSKPCLLSQLADKFLCDWSLFSTEPLIKLALCTNLFLDEQEKKILAIQ